MSIYKPTERQVKQVEWAWQMLTNMKLHFAAEILRRYIVGTVHGVDPDKRHDR